MTRKNNHIDSNFDSFLKEENVEIKEDETREILNAYKKIYSQNICDVDDLPSKILAIDNNDDWIEI